MQRLETFEQLASKLEEARHQRTLSDDAFRQALSGWYLSPALFGTVPKDPYSAEFKAFQQAIYQRLAQQTYAVANEETPFDLDHQLNWPYPYSTQSAQTVGEHLLGYGWVIGRMRLPAGSHILEIGSGFGSLTLHLAQMGYHVTCLDMSAALLDLIEQRTAHLPTPVKTVCGDMATAKITGTFDAVIFNASFHHTLEHQAVFQRVSQHVAPGGMVVFSAEPIVSRWTKHVPYPWGIRLDGISVWSICEWGWMELGFQESYFAELVAQAGWNLVRYTAGFSPYADVWIATKQAPPGRTRPIPVPFQKYGVDLESMVLRWGMRGVRLLQTLFARITANPKK